VPPSRQARALALSALSLSCFGRSARAADEERARAVTFAEARAAAEAHAPEVTLSERRGDVARAQIDVVGALANPTVTALTARQTARVGVGMSLPLPLFGQRSTAVEAAQSDADAARLDVEAIRWEARLAGTLAWLDLWEAQQRARLLADAATDAARLATIADERFRAGSVPRVDVLRTAADRARAQDDAAFAGAAVPAAAARLAIVMGMGDRGRLDAAGRPGLADAVIDWPRLDALLAEHPALARDRAQAAAAAAHVRAERRQRWPIVTADVVVNLHDPTLPGTDVIGGVSFDAPVLSLRGGAIARARAEQALAETTLALEQRRLAAQLADAYQRAQGSGARVRSLASDVLPALAEVRRMTEEGYRDGRIDLLRLLDAQRALLESRIAQVDAEATWERALADVERAAGVRLDLPRPNARPDAR
jgi:cobalt-zinc-cadmium efflux system outer membrane protein